jgi:hypothetical protein
MYVRYTRSLQFPVYQSRGAAKGDTSPLCLYQCRFWMRQRTYTSLQFMLLLPKMPSPTRFTQFMKSGVASYTICNSTVVLQGAGWLSQHSVWLRTGRLGHRGSIPGRDERTFPLACVSRPAQGPPSLLYNGYRESFLRG